MLNIHNVYIEHMQYTHSMNTQHICYNMQHIYISIYIECTHSAYIMNENAAIVISKHTEFSFITLSVEYIIVRNACFKERKGE